MSALVAGVGALAAIRAGSGLRSWVATLRCRRRRGLEPPRESRSPERWRRALERAGVDADPAVLLLAWAVAVLVAMVAATTTGGGTILLAVTIGGPPVVLVGARHRGERARIAQLPQALDAAAASLRSGSSLSTAIEDASTIGGRVGGELAALVLQIRRGRPTLGAIGQWVQQAGDDETRLAGAALAVAATVGGPAADAIDGAAGSLRERAAVAGEVGALSVQARLSAMVLTVAPLAFGILLTSIDPPSARFLLGTPTGWACVTVGVVLDLAGFLWMERVVRGVR